MMNDVGNLKRAGLKATLPRLRILEIFENANQRHLSAEDIYRRLLDKHLEIGLATVYRALAQLQQAGLLKHAHFTAGKALYELDDGHHHDHLVCTSCGLIREFHDNAIENDQHRVAKKLGYELIDHTLILYGNCTKTGCEHRPEITSLNARNPV